jgi:hypothetical protein
MDHKPLAAQVRNVRAHHVARLFFRNSAATLTRRTSMLTASQLRISVPQKVSSKNAHRKKKSDMHEIRGDAGTATISAPLIGVRATHPLFRHKQQRPWRIISSNSLLEFLACLCCATPPTHDIIPSASILVHCSLLVRLSLLLRKLLHSHSSVWPRRFKGLPPQIRYEVHTRNSSILLASSLDLDLEMVAR